MAEVKTGWDHSEKRSKEAGGGRFVSLKGDGDSVTGFFLGEPATKELVWDEKKEQYEDFDKAKHGDVRTTPRFMINFCVVAEGGKATAPAVKILEMNTASWTGLLTNKGKYGLDKISYEVKRSGGKGDTKMILHILPEGPNSPFKYETVAAFLASAPLHDLAKADDAAPAAATNGAGHTNGTAAAGDSTIDDATMKSIVDRVKDINAKHDKEALAKFQAWMKSVGIAKVRDMKVSQVPLAETEIAKLGPQAAAPAAGGDDVWT